MGLVCGRLMKNLLKKDERLWVKDETLCVSLVYGKWMKRLPKNDERLWIKDETLCVSLC